MIFINIETILNNFKYSSELYHFVISTSWSTSTRICWPFNGHRGNVEFPCSREWVWVTRVWHISLQCNGWFQLTICQGNAKQLQCAALKLICLPRTPLLFPPTVCHPLNVICRSSAAASWNKMWGTASAI